MIVYAGAYGFYCAWYMALKWWSVGNILQELLLFVYYEKNPLEGITSDYMLEIE